MLPSETMIWQPEFTDKTLSRKPGAVQKACCTLKKQEGVRRRYENAYSCCAG
ncbi:PapI protein [Escherichia coli]|nr:PapI protein [Escherichia coli]